MAPSLWHACMAHGIPVAPLADEKVLINALLDKVTTHDVPDEEDIKETFYNVGKDMHLTEENNQQAVRLKWAHMQKIMHTDDNIIYVKDKAFNDFYISHIYMKSGDGGIVTQLVPVLKSNDGVFYRKSVLHPSF